MYQNNFGRFNVFWKPSEAQSMKICEGGGMGYELRKNNSKNKKEELVMRFECKPVARKFEVEEMRLSLMNL
jgi:hypothetical protein